MQIKGFTKPKSYNVTPLNYILTVSEQISMFTHINKCHNMPRMNTWTLHQQSIVHALAVNEAETAREMQMPNTQM